MKLKVSLKNIINDQEALNEYIEALENDIDSTIDVDNTVDTMLKNILDNYDNFKDRRALRASNISAITELLRLKAELPQKRIQHKKTILDIMTKKEELELKRQTATAASQLAENTNNMTALLLNNLDNNNIQPIILDAEITKECSSLIDTPESFENTLDLNSTDSIQDETIVADVESLMTAKEINKIEVINAVKNATSVSQILALQKELESLNNVEEEQDG